MPEIICKKGHVCIVDDEDWDRLSALSWAVQRDRHNGRLYAYRWVRRADGKYRQSRMHREIMGLGPWPADRREVDHVSLDTLDNRKQNLRICNRSQNNCNRGMRKDNRSGIKGVSADPKKPGYWKAQIMHQKKAYNLGSHPTKDLAAEVYAEAAKRLHREFARIARAA